MIINMEAGGFDKFPMGEFEKRMDKNSANPGDHELEKCISGVYLGNVIAYTIKQAAKEGLFSAHNRIAELPYFTMVEVDAFLRDPYGHNLLADACDNDDDVETMYCFIDQAIDRGAKLICGNLSACMIKMDGGKKRSTPVRIVVGCTPSDSVLSIQRRQLSLLRSLKAGIFSQTVPSKDPLRSKRLSAMKALSKLEK